MRTVPQTRQAAPRNLARRIGIHGPRNAGKTCYLGCLYGCRSAPGVQVSCSDSATINYLRGVWNTLAQQKLPLATAMGLPTELRFAIQADANRARAVQLCDYAGALVQPVPEQATTLTCQLNEGVRAWLRSCHALLLFLDSSQPELVQVDALDLLLTELARPGPGGYVPERPVGLVLTKWDSQGPISDDPAHEEQRARDFLEAQPVFRQVYQKLADAGDRLRVFPVSSFGPAARGALPPPVDELRPCHLHAPLAWAAEQADTALLDEARLQARRHLDHVWKVRGLPLLAWPDHGSAIRAYETVRHAYDLHQGPVAEQLTHELDELRARRWQPLLARGSLVVTLLLVLAFVLGWYGSRRAEEEYARLEQFRQAHPAREQAEQRLAEDVRFLGAWWSRLAPERRVGVRAWHEADGWVATELETYAQAREQGRQLEQEQRFGEAIALYRDFNRRFPESPHVVELEGRVLALVPLQADQEEYERIRQAAARGHQAGPLEETSRRVQEYLAGSRSPRRMKEEVRRWEAWFQGLQQEGDCTIVVEALSIPPGSDLDATFGTQPRVVIEMNGVRHATTWFKGNNPTPSVELGPFPFRWGQPGTLHVRVEGYHYLTRNDVAEQTVTDDRFLLARAHGPFVVTCRKGKSITVHLRCPRAVPPELPPYRGSL